MKITRGKRVKVIRKDLALFGQSGIVLGKQGGWNMVDVNGAVYALANSEVEVTK